MEAVAFCFMLRSKVGGSCSTCTVLCHSQLGHFNCKQIDSCKGADKGIFCTSLTCGSNTAAPAA